MPLAIPPARPAGGAVDRVDRERAGGNEELAARLAAAREAAEEAGVAPDPHGMALVSHWTTPVDEPRRDDRSDEVAAERANGS